MTFGKPVDPNDLEREGEEPRDRILSTPRERVAKLGAGRLETAAERRGE